MATTRIIRRTLAGVTIALLAAACGGSGDDGNAKDIDTGLTVIDDDSSTDTSTDTNEASDQDTADLPDPCSLLTATEVGAVIGTPAESSGPEQLLGGGTSCTYTAPASGRQPALEVRIHAGRDAYECGQDECAAGGFADEGQIEPVSGLGEDAYVDNGSYGVDRIAWFRDGMTIEILINDQEKHTANDYETVAQKVDGKLGALPGG